MALIKTIELENGISLNYHRISSINKVTNSTTVIEVASYISKEKREEEKEKIKQGQEFGEAIPMNILIETSYFSKEYDESEKIKELYEYLKTIERFKDAEDI